VAINGLQADRENARKKKAVLDVQIKERTDKISDHMKPAIDNDNRDLEQRTAHIRIL
jgi:hypothetical protein